MALLAKVEGAHEAIVQRRVSSFVCPLRRPGQLLLELVNPSPHGLKLHGQGTARVAEVIRGARGSRDCNRARWH